MDRPRVSVVMPLYNKAGLVREAIASVQAQTVADWELLVVDDGSTDAGPEQARAAALADPRIRVLGQANQGVSAARNAAVAQAAADVVAFLDADDVWSPEFLAAVLALRDRFPQSRWWATGYFIKVENAPPRPNRLAGLPRDFQTGILPNYFKIAAMSEPPVWTSATAVALDALMTTSNGFPVGVRSGEDLLTWAALALVHPLAYDRRPLAVFRVSGIERRPDSADTVSNRLAQLHATHPAVPGLGDYRAAWHRMRAAMWLRFDESARARIDAGHALRLAPLNPRSLYLWVLCRLPPGWRLRFDAWIRGAHARIMRSRPRNASSE